MTASLTLRDLLILQCWAPAHLEQPVPDPRGPHFPVQVWGVIDDPRMKPTMPEPFADVVSWWPASRMWTVTHQCRADVEAIDLPVRVVLWQPLPPVATWAEVLGELKS